MCRYVSITTLSCPPFCSEGRRTLDYIYFDIDKINWAAATKWPVRPAKTLIRVFAVRSLGSKEPKTSLCGQRRLFRVSRCQGWSESSLGACRFFFQVLAQMLKCDQPIYINKEMTLNMWKHPKPTELVLYHMIRALFKCEVHRLTCTLIT